VLMANHGMLCVGKSADDALHTALVVEHTARIIVGARLLGGDVPLPEKISASFADIYRMIRSGWNADD